MGSYRSLWMDSELEIFRSSVRRFVREEFVPHEERWREQRHIDREAWQAAGEMGMLLTDIPEKYGGGGGTFAHECVVTEELSYAGVTSLGAAVQSIVAHYLVAFGTEEQKKKWLPAMAQGRTVAALAMTEPTAGSDVQAIRTTATRQGEQYVIRGSKTFITNGYHADLICVAVKTDATQKGAHGISLLMLETKNLQGYRVGRMLDKIGQHGQDTCELFFDDVRVSTANLLGTEEGKGFAQMMEQLPYERAMIGVGAVAAMEHAVEITAQYVKERKIFGKTLFDLQNTRFKLAECKTEAYIARIFIDNCIQQVIAGTLDAATAAMAKWWSTEKQFHIADECLQLYGGYGYCNEYPIARIWADSRVQRIYGGANEVMKELVARTL